MKRLQFFFTIVMFCTVCASAQHANYDKMSTTVRQLALQQELIGRQGDVEGTRSKPICSNQSQELCAFVKVRKDAQRVFQEHHCKSLAQFGDIFIVSVPLQQLAKLSLEKYVDRIEARRSNGLHTDSLAYCLDAMPVYAGMSPLPQAYTGRGVVVGVQDVGFDLTHPNFFDATATNYRILRFWDQLSVDTLKSKMYVGASYEGRTEILAYAHSRDGLIQTHGTHTLGIAAGSGYNSAYRGMAYESDICLVSNFVVGDEALVDSANRYKYTYATDALGFKYIMDYAKYSNQPCVISFSEGSHQDFHGDDVLYNAVLDSLSGPGRIIIASAGNDGQVKSYFHKPIGQAGLGTFVEGRPDNVYVTLKSASPFQIRFTSYDDTKHIHEVFTQDILRCKDSIYVDTMLLGNKQYVFSMVGYRSCYDSAELVYDVRMWSKSEIGHAVPFSFEILGAQADVEVFRVGGVWTANQLDERLCAGECTHNIHSPASLSSVIGVGATSYRTGITNYLGEWRPYNQGVDGVRGAYSSVGPTYDGRIKPDVMAPGTNIISSYSSYYLEKNPKANDIKSDVAHFEFNGRTYAWNSNAGTSMSTPALAGAVALWLQAKPTLTREDIIDVFAKTCTHYDTSLTYPNNWYGYGQIDVYKGLLYILGVSGVKGISSHQPAGVQFEVRANRKIEIKLKELSCHHFSVCVYSTSGVLLERKSFDAGFSSYLLDVSSYPRGVYVIQLNSSNPLLKGSTLIRI